jgi:hypothetical protein
METGHAMSEPVKKARRRRPALKPALEAARKAGLEVRAATIEGGKIILAFADGTTVSSNNENEWSRRLKDVGYGKNLICSTSRATSTGTAR